MNNKDKTTLAAHCISMLKIWGQIHDPADAWKDIKARQAYQDGFNGLLHHKLIQDYSITPPSVKINNIWYR